MVGVLCLAEVGHSAVEPVVDNAVAVLSVVEGFPTFCRNGEALRTVADVEGGLQVVRTAHRGHGVKVDADDQIGVVGNKCCKVGVYLVGTEFQLVKFLECEVEVVVVGGKRCGAIRGVIDRSCGTDVCRAGELVGRFVVFLNGDGEVAVDAFVLLELQVGPLPLVDEVRKAFFELLEDTDIRTLNLRMVDGDTCIQFLRLECAGDEG